MFAIFCALRYCDLVAVTSVAGNVGIEHTTYNALGILALAKASVPVHRGASRPLNGSDAVDARHVHGESGLGGVELPSFSGTTASDDAITALFDETAAGDVTVVAIGPLTNIALAIQQDPSWTSRIPRLVIMGGSTNSGNVTPHAEFNIWADPEAAAVVFDSGVHICMAGLNLTRQVTMGADEIATMRHEWFGHWSCGRRSTGLLQRFQSGELTASSDRRCTIRAPCSKLSGLTSSIGSG